MGRRRVKRRRRASACALSVLLAVALVAWDLSAAPEVASAGDFSPATELPPLPSDDEAPAPSDDGASQQPEGEFADGTLPGFTSQGDDRPNGGFDKDESEKLDEFTSPTAEVYENKDGSRTASVSSAPVRYQDEAGTWRDIDLELEQQPDGSLGAKASPLPITLPADPKEGLARWESPAGPVILGLPEVAADVAEPTATERGAVWKQADGLSVQVKVLTDGFEQDLILDKPGGPSSYRMQLELPDGMTARQLEGYGVELVDKAGEVVAAFGGGQAFDSTGEIALVSAVSPVTTTLVEQVGAVATVEVAVDPAWLADPARKYPVTIDPTFTVFGNVAGTDTWVNLGNPSFAGWSDSFLGVGYWPESEPDALGRAFLYFNLFSQVGAPWGVPSAQVSVSSANLYLTPFYTNGNQDHPMNIEGLGSNFGTTTSWFNQPAADGKGVRTSYGLGEVPIGGDDFVVFDVKSLADSWLHDGQTNFGMSLRSANEEDPDGGKIFWAGNAGQFVPTLQITWAQGPPPASPIAPDDEITLPTLQPTLSVNPVPGVQQYWFRVASSKDPNNAPAGNIVAESGVTSQTSWPVPVGALTDGGTYYWTAFTNLNNVPTRPLWTRKFTVKLRLGTSTPSPYDAAGPVSVNLATGNLTASTSSPTFPTVGGDVGLTYTYNSQTPPSHGLSAKFYNGYDQFGPTGGVAAQQTDAAIAANWGFGSPGPGVEADTWAARWDGFITMQQEGNYKFGTVNDDGVRIWIDGQPHLDDWSVQSPDFTAPQFGPSSVHFNAGETRAIRIEYFDNLGGAVIALFYKRNTTTTWVLPGSLTTTAPALSKGWDVSADLDGALAYTSFYRFGPYAIFRGPNADSPGYLWKDGSWISPPGEYGTVANTPTGGLVMHNDDGNTYVFDALGRLLETRSAMDDKRPASPTYTWDGNRLTSITDPVSQREITLTYAPDDCGDQPPGFASVPNGKLCKVQYWDGTETRLHYIQPAGCTAGAQLARMIDPGDEVTDFAYNASCQLTRIRDPLAADAVAAGVRANDDTTHWAINYVGTKVDFVEGPAPTVGAPRPRRTYAYGLGSTAVSTAGVTGDRVVTFDNRARVLSDTDPTGRQSAAEWDPIKDLQVSTTDSAGLKSTTVYDHAERPTDTYGPAPAAWYGTDNRPLPAFTGQVPRTQTRYDEGLSSLAVAYWDNKDFGGAPIAHSTGLGTPDGSIFNNWSSGTSPLPGEVPHDNWAARLTGEILLPATGIYQFYVTHDDGVRLWIDDQLVIDRWKNGFAVHDGAYNNTTANALKKIRIDFYDNTGGANLSLSWMPPGAPIGSTVPGANLRPRYGLSTSSTNPDGRSTATQYTAPHMGLPSATIVDPGGLALTESTTYEPDSAGNYWRRLSRTLPAGNQWAYSYYGGMQSVPNPCNTSTSANQGGLLHKRTSPDPDSTPETTARVDETVYDAAGRGVATRVGGEPWTCAAYDLRGRVVTRTTQAFGVQTEPRTITYDYAVGGNPLVTRVEDAAGEITTTVDLLGRTIEKTDVWGRTTTTAYDQAGRPTDTSGTAGAVHTDYDAAGRVTAVRLDNQTVAVPAYDAAGRLESVSYPAGGGNGGNGTSLAPIARDALGRGAGLTWLDPAAATITSDSVTRALSGDVTDQVIDGVDANPGGPNFTYDAAGRLTAAKVPGHELGYSYEASGGCGALPTAGRNSNRTATTDTSSAGTTTSTYCYDQADRLTQTTAPGIGTVQYDEHGNTTRLGDQTMGYDAADRHMITSTDDDRGSVTYIRDAVDLIVQRTETYLAPIELRSVATASTSGTATTLTIPAPTEVAPFDVLIAQVVSAGATPITAPTGWTEVANTTSGSNLRTATFSRVATESEPTGWDFALAAETTAAGGIAAYIGVDATNPVDAVATAASDPGTPTASHIAPAVTTTTPGTRVLTLFGLGTPTDLTPDPLTSEQYDINTGTSGVSAALADFFAAAAGDTGYRTASSPTVTHSANHTIALRPARVTATRRYTEGATMDESNTVIERMVRLPGGVILTKRGGGDVWSYPNVHGDVAATADTAGTKQGATHTYDPFGQALSDVPDNREGRFDFGWTGQRPTDHVPGLQPIIEMGARQYHPGLGRFLETDPVEGGSANDYDYAGADPVNGSDLDGDLARSPRPRRRAVRRAPPRPTLARRGGIGLALACVRAGHGVRNCARAQVLADAANTLSDGVGDVRGLTRRQRDAIRHALWSAFMTVEFGRSTARGIATLYEDNSPQRNSVEERSQDFYNNRQGRLLGQIYRDAGDREITFEGGGNADSIVVDVEGRLDAGRLCWSHCLERTPLDT